MQAHISAERSLKLESLSAWLLRHGALDLWRNIFVAATTDAVQFRNERLTLLGADYPVEWTSSDAVLFAKRFRAEPQGLEQARLALSFENPRDALRAAVALQRMTQRQRVRSVLLTSEVSVAAVTHDRLTRRVCFALEDWQMDPRHHGAAPGTIQLCADTLDLVRREIVREAPEAIVMTEFTGDSVTAASITLPPRGPHQLSTFAGLGLTFGGP